MGRCRVDQHLLCTPECSTNRNRLRIGWKQPGLCVAPKGVTLAARCASAWKSRSSSAKPTRLLMKDSTGVAPPCVWCTGDSSPFMFPDAAAAAAAVATRRLVPWSCIRLPWGPQLLLLLPLQPARLVVGLTDLLLL